MNTTYKWFEQTEVPKGEMIISRTDLSGDITFANDLFAQISGYSVDELVGNPHSIVRHPDMPKSAFKEMWDTLKNGDIWRGYVKNLRKDNGYYWVYVEVSGVYKSGKLIEYKSLRSPINSQVQKEHQDRYDKLRKSEEQSCRVVFNISTTNIQKITTYAEQEEISEDKILDYILSDRAL